MRNKNIKAGGAMTARLLYTVCFCAVLFLPAGAASISGGKGHVSIGEAFQFSLVNSAGSVEIIIPVKSRTADIPSELTELISIDENGRIILKIPVDKEPEISILKDSIIIDWITSNSSLDSVFSSTLAPAYPLGPGDKLLVEVYGIENMNKEVVVDPTGYITLPLLDRLLTQNMTLNAIQKLLEDKYSDYINKPQVNIQLKEYGSRFVNIIGEVERPGRIPLKSTFRLLDAISEAGGFTAKSGDIEIQRRDESGAIQKRLISKESLLGSSGENDNIFVYDQDTLNILPVSSIYISGEVARPQGIEFSRDLTLLRAIAKSGGFTQWANKDKIVILRKDSAGQTQAIKVDAQKIEKGKMSDPPLMPNDQIVVYERKLF